jgi:hypothetical protein
MANWLSRYRECAFVGIPRRGTLVDHREYEWITPRREQIAIVDRFGNNNSTDRDHRSLGF